MRQRFWQIGFAFFCSGGAALAAGNSAPAPVAPAAGSRVLIEVKNEMASPLPGAYVEADGKRVGISDELGRAYAALTPGAHKLLAYIPGFQFGQATVTVPEGGTIAHGVEVLVTEPDLELRLSALQPGSILPEKAGALFAELRDRKRKLVPIEEVIDFGFVDLNSDETTDITRYFLIDKGRLRLHAESTQALRLLLAKPRDQVRLRLRARVENFEKRVVDIERDLLLGRYEFQGKIISEKSGPITLRVRIAPVQWMPGLKSNFLVKTTADGSFRLPNMPFGSIEIVSESSAADSTRLWSWWVDCFGPTRVELRPESLESIRAGELPLRYLERKDDDRFSSLGKRRKS